MTTGTVQRASEAKEVERSTRAPTQAEIIRKAIEQQAGRFQAILPVGFDSVRFHNLVLTAVKSKPALMECFLTEQGKLSVLLAAMEAASVGLEPDTPMQEAWLLPRRNNGRMECQLSIGYQGLVKLARRSGEIKSLRADVVRQGDLFRYSFGLEADEMVHVPAPSGKRGALVYAYAVVRYLNGGYDFVVLDRDEIEARRAKSDSWKSDKSRPYSPWTTSEPAMWRKSAVRELSKLMPKSAEFARAEDRDERVLSFDDTGAIAAIEAGPPENVDPQTGEITDAEIIEPEPQVAPGDGAPEAAEQQATLDVDDELKKPTK